MKTKLFTFILAIATFGLLVGCEKDEILINLNHGDIPDESFNSYLLQNVDKNADGIISESEAKAVTEIDASGYNIKSFKGIEHFPNLKILNCSKTSVDSLNVRDMPSLEELYCENVASGVWINVSNSAVKIVICDNCDSLNISNCPDLVTLTASGDLKYIDLNKSTKLIYLKCERYGWDNDINTDISNCSELEVLEIHNNNMIDFSKNTKLKELYIPSTENCDIDISKNTELETIVAGTNLSGYSCHILSFKNNTKLKNLSYNVLDNAAVIDLSNNTLLEHLNLDGGRAIKFENCKNLKEFILTSKTMKTLDLRPLSGLEIAHIHDCDSLMSLDASGLQNLDSIRVNHAYGAADVYSALEVNTENCKNLKKMYISRVKSLNASGCTSLESFEKISCDSLNMSNCTSLTKLPVICKFVTLNVSGCTALTSLDLKPDFELSILTSLNVRGCTAMTSLDASRCHELKILDSSDSYIKTIYLPQYNHITSLKKDDVTEIVYK